MSYQLIIHGGAGNIVDEHMKEAHRKALQPILEHGQQNLHNRASALDVVDQCVQLLENDSTFNAGKGSTLNSNGEVEMDAAIMQGKNLETGAVAGVKYIQNPIHLARTIMENSEHVMLIGEGARAFARQYGVSEQEMEYFITERRKQQWEQAKKQDTTMLDHSPDQPNEYKYGTVGAVARDVYGNLASATSTGGMTNKKFGRVGDSPIIGSGVFADDETCAVSATGKGEDLLRTTLARTTSEFIRYKHMDAQQATEAAIEYLVRKVNGDGGLITIDKEGNIGAKYSSPAMSHGSVDENGINIYI